MILPLQHNISCLRRYFFAKISRKVSRNTTLAYYFLIQAVFIMPQERNLPPIYRFSAPKHIPSGKSRKMRSKNEAKKQKIPPKKPLKQLGRYFPNFPSTPQLPSVSPPLSRTSARVRDISGPCGRLRRPVRRSRRPSPP